MKCWSVSSPCEHKIDRCIHSQGIVHVQTKYMPAPFSAYLVPACTWGVSTRCKDSSDMTSRVLRKKSGLARMSASKTTTSSLEGIDRQSNSLPSDRVTTTDEEEEEADRAETSVGPSLPLRLLSLGMSEAGTPLSVVAKASGVRYFLNTWLRRAWFRFSDFPLTCPGVRSRPVMYLA